jgi:hypothetical protein
MREAQIIIYLLVAQTRVMGGDTQFSILGE